MRKKKTSPKPEEGKKRLPGNSLRGLIISGGIVLILLFSLGYAVNKQGIFKENRDPLELATEAIANSFAADTYRFKARSTLFIEDEKRVFSVLEGEKSLDKRHIEGSILGTAINIYHIGDCFYQQDPLNGKWNKVEGISLKGASILINELNPEKNFLFSSPGRAVDLGKTEVEGIKTRRIKLFPVLEDKWIEEYFKDITFDLYISRRGEAKIIQAIISGVSKENTQATLVIENYFHDFGKKISINPPMLP